MKVFLASSNEINEERKELALFLIDKGLQVEKWEIVDHSIKVDKSFQDYINEEHLHNSDVAIFIFKNKIGEFTKEEFEYAKKHFIQNKQKILVYFLKTDFNSLEADKLFKLVEFKDYIANKMEHKQYYADVDSIKDLKLDLITQLKLFVRDGFRDKESTYQIDLKRYSALPNRDSKFIGRDKDIETIIKKLKESKQLTITAFLQGMGGIGKSSLIIEIANDIKDSWVGASKYSIDKPLFTDGILWITLEKEQNYEDIVEKQIIPQLNINREVFEKKFNELLENKDILIIVDSAEQNNIARRKILNKFQNYSILLTSRYPIDNLDKFEIDVLPEDESIELFKKHHPFTADSENSIKKLCTGQLGGLPLAIMIVANYLKNTDRTIDEIIGKIEKLLQMRGNLTEQDKYDISLEIIFDASYHELTEMEKKVFVISSVFKYPFKEEYLLEIMKKNEDINDISNELDGLIKSSLLNRNKHLYSFHPLVREYAFKEFLKFENSPEIQEAYEIYLVDISTKEEILKVIYNELLAIYEDNKRKENWERCYEISKNLANWLEDRGYREKRLELSKDIYDHIKKFKDNKQKYIILENYGDSLSRLGYHNQAEEIFESVIKNEYAHCWDYYMLYAIYKNLNKYRLSYENNLRYVRECLYKDSYQYSSFLKTNAHISNNFYKLDQSINYIQANCFTLDHKANKFKALIDLVTVHFYKCEYDICKRYIDILRDLFNPEKMSITDMVTLESYSLWIELFEDNKNIISSIESVEHRYDLLQLGSEDFDQIQKIKAFYYIKTENYNSAKKAIENMIESKNRDYSFAILYSFIDKNNAKNIILRLLESSKYSYREKAKLKLYLTKVYVEDNSIELAKSYYIEFKNVLKDYLNPIELKIENIIKNKIEVLTNKKALIKEDHFFIDSGKLPKEVVTKDNKNMVLVSESFSIFGEDNFEIPNIDQIFEKAKDILSNDIKLRSILYLPNFYIDKYPVTVNEYIEFCKKSEKDESAYEKYESLEEKDKSKPIEGLTIKAMLEYAEFYDKKLPLPEEWEKAYRGKNNYNYPWGDEWKNEIAIDVDYDKLNGLKELFLDHDNFEEYYSWIDELKKESAKNKDDFNNAIEGIKADSSFETFEDYYNWFKNYDDNQSSDNNINEKINLSFQDSVKVDKYYFYILALHSLSLNVNETLRVFSEVPNLNQFQVDALISVFTEELEKFKEIQKDHPDDIKKLFNLVKESSSEIIYKLIYEKDDLDIFGLNSKSAEVIEYLEDIKFNSLTMVNKYYFFKLLFHSLSLNTLDKIRVIKAIPTLSQFQIDELVKVFEEEADRFYKLSQEHPDDIKTLYKKLQSQAIDIISELSTKKYDSKYYASDYGVKYNLGNGYEVTLKKDNVIFKGSIISENYREDLKGKTNFVESIVDREINIFNNPYPKTFFRCVKPIYSMDDLKDIQKPLVPQLEYKVKETI